MKIVYSTDQVYMHGGIEKVLTQKLNYLVANPNFEVHLITTEQKEKAFCYPISEKVMHHDLGIDYVRTKSYFSLVNIKKVPKHIKSLNGTLEQIKPDVLIVCNLAFDFYFIPFISSGIKTIKEYHASRYYYCRNLPNASFLNKIIYKINNYIEQKYTHIVVLNKDEKKCYKSNNITVIPNAVPKVSLKGIQRKNIILAAGRIAPVKQYNHLIEAWSLITQKFPNWEVHIYGEGDECLVNELTILIEKLGTRTIKLMGATNNLEEKMKAASIYALTSATECFPMVLLEAMSQGLPIIAYDCPHGPRNIITNNEDGILVKHNNITNFATALANFIEDKEQRISMGKTAMNNIVRYNEIKIMKAWMQLFNKKTP